MAPTDKRPRDAGMSGGRLPGGTPLSARKRAPQHTGIEFATKRRVASVRPGPVTASPLIEERSAKVEAISSEDRGHPRSRRRGPGEFEPFAKLDAGHTVTSSRITVEEAAEAWIKGAEAGTILARNGEPYKQPAFRSNRNLLRQRVIPTFGRDRLTAVDKPRLQRWVRSLLEEGLSASTIRNTMTAVRVIYREAVDNGEVQTNPTQGLKLPAPHRHEPRLVPPGVAIEMLEVLPYPDRAIWAMAFFGGLRRGELWGLRQRDVDRGRGIIRVRNNEDAKEGRVDPKSRAGKRPVPITIHLAGVLKDFERERGPVQGAASAISRELARAIQSSGSALRACGLTRGSSPSVCTMRGTRSLRS